MIKIIPFEDKYLGHAAQLFSTVYSDEEGVYSVDKAKRRIQDDLKTGVDYSFVVLDDEKAVGEVICKRRWADTGLELEIDTIQVDLLFQNRGIAKLLMAAVVDKAKTTGIKQLTFVADTSKSFPSGWYERLGFKKTHWVYFMGKPEDLKV